ncbi:MAG: hypothetical protein Q9187_001752 [Circinaria calcarea]
MGGKAGRFVCVFLPMVLTILALIFQIMVGLGGTNRKNNYLSNIYFLQANTTSIAQNSSFADVTAGPNIPSVDKTSDGKLIIRDFYTISLWNYCTGKGVPVKKSKLATGSQKSTVADFCTKRKTQFWFNPSEVWGLNQTSTFKTPKDFDKVIDNYKTRAARWITALYILTVTSTCIEILVGIGALFSRLGSLFTTLSSLVSTIFSFAFAVLATATYAGMTASGNQNLKPYGIQFRLGSTIYIYIWLSVVCSLVSVLFWAFSSCCCSGRSRNPEANSKAITEGHSYTRVDGPYAQHSTAPSSTIGGRPGAYEAFRH